MTRTFPEEALCWCGEFPQRANWDFFFCRQRRLGVFFYDRCGERERKGGNFRLESPPFFFSFFWPSPYFIFWQIVIDGKRERECVERQGPVCVHNRSSSVAMSCYKAGGAKICGQKWQNQICHLSNGKKNVNAKHILKMARFAFFWYQKLPVGNAESSRHLLQRREFMANKFGYHFYILICTL